CWSGTIARRSSRSSAGSTPLSALRANRPVRGCRVHNARREQGDHVSREKSVDEGRGRDSRAWLGPPGQGGERLARVFGIGTSSQRDVGRTLEDLRTSLMRLEEEVDELALIVRRTVTHSSSVEPDHPSVVELPHVPQDSNREYWLSRCDHFTVYAGNRVLGAVDGMRFGSRLDRPDFLEVRCGRLGRRI